MNLIKKIRRYLYQNFDFVRSCWFWLQFVKNNRYIPNFKNPKTYNEKVNYRKNNPKHELFSICSDKIAAKEWVAERIGEEYIIPNYFVGDAITPDKIKEILAEKGDCLLKANHNSGPVYLLTTKSTDAEIEAACKDVNHQLTVDFGKLQNEPWYSKIKPGVLVEKRLEPEEGESDIRDYKFHVFKQDDGTFKVVVHVDFDRNSNHNRTYFDENLTWLPFSVEYPTIRTFIEQPKNYHQMVELAKKLAAPFSYVRVDFYNVAGDIYFGEMTYAHGSGSEVFTMQAYDLWMGNLWQGDPSY